MLAYFNRFKRPPQLILNIFYKVDNVQERPQLGCSRFFGFLKKSVLSMIDYNFVAIFYRSVYRNQQVFYLHKTNNIKVVEACVK